MTDLCLQDIKSQGFPSPAVLHSSTTLACVSPGEGGWGGDSAWLIGSSADRWMCGGFISGFVRALLWGSTFWTQCRPFVRPVVLECGAAFLVMPHSRFGVKCTVRWSSCKLPDSRARLAKLFDSHQDRGRLEFHTMLGFWFQEGSPFPFILLAPPFQEARAS